MKMAKCYFASCKTLPLESGTETIFLTMIQRPEQFFNAIECIANKISRVPSAEVLSAVIFKILMNEECDKKTAVAANDYLNDTFSIYPPSDCSRRCFYKTILTGKKDFGFTHLWSVFEHIINSSFIHYKIWEVEEEEKRNPIPYPNCDILVEFYIRVVIENYDYLSSERAFRERAEKSLVMDLFWPTESYNLSAAKEFPSQLLQWIDKIYFHSARISKISAFNSIHKLLNLMIECIVQSEFSPGKPETSIITTDSLTCNTLCIFDITKVIFNICKEVFHCVENFRRFLHHLSSKAVQFKVCEYTLLELLSQPSVHKFPPCTLQTIVTVYMFPNKLTTGKRGRPKKQTGNDLSLEDEGKIKKALFTSASKTGESELHELCRANKPADLYIKLRSSTTVDVNQKNNLGQTPLHLACLSRNYHCVKVLIDECFSDSSKYELNMSAVDEKGQTSLHVAIKEEKENKQEDKITDIAKCILKYGGSRLLEVKDKYGRKPLHYASKRMKLILKEVHVYSDTDKPAISLKTIENLDVPTFQNFKEYSFYCHVLHFLLTYYAHIYHLYYVRKLVKIENSSLLKVLKHEDKNCPHFVSCGENTVCSEDFDLIKILPDIVNHFVKRICECAKGKELNLDLELFPTQMFAAVLD